MAAITRTAAAPLSLVSLANLQTRCFQTPSSGLGCQMNGYGLSRLSFGVLSVACQLGDHWQPQGDIYHDTPVVKSSEYQGASLVVREHPDITRKTQRPSSPSSEMLNVYGANVTAHLHTRSGPAMSDSPRTGAEQSHRHADSMALGPVSASECTRNGAKYYICSCGHRTKSMGDMSRHHESRKHSSPKYTCFCGKKFTRKDARTRHEKKCKK